MSASFLTRSLFCDKTTVLANGGFFVKKSLSAAEINKIRRLAEIFSRHTSLFAGAEFHSLINHPPRISIEAVTVTVWTNHHLCRDNRVTALTDLIGHRISRNLLRLCKAGLL